MIAPDIQAEIRRRLRQAELEHGVRILFAIESGSRAWGFASPNSDYDVRFIYCHEASWYQAVDLEERRDVIEYPIVDDIDLNGWDVRKALRLFWKSNPTFVEWLKSPITYLEPSRLRALSLQALPLVYSPEKGIHHYRSMAKKNFRGFLQTPMVRLKKYFYVLRPLLAAQWLEKTGEAAPIEFEQLLPLLAEQTEVLAAVQTLLEQKRQAPELGLAPSVPVLQAYIEQELARNIMIQPQVAAHEQSQTKQAKRSEVIQTLNGLFRHCLSEG